MRASHLALALLCASGCARAPRAPRPEAVPLPAHAAEPIEAIVLTRTRCFGTCPAYTATLRRGRPIAVTGDAARTGQASGTVADATLDRLAAQARASGFYSLPARTESDSTLCAMRATDHPYVTIGIVQGGVRTEVRDYTGCYQGGDPPRRAPALQALSAFAAAIDAAAGTSASATRPGKR
jgi:hypothetical protein